MRLLVGALLAALVTVPAFADSNVQEVKARLDAATDVMNAMVNASDSGIPLDLLNKASCVIVVPGIKAGGFIVGAQYGRGFFSCREPNGRWSAPGGVSIKGGKFGLLIGAKETDAVMLVMNKGGMEHLLSSNFQIGGEASGAAGPVGRSAKAMTDAQMHAQILSYSRSRGVFGGLDITGAAFTEDDDAYRALYGRDISNKTLVSENVHVPAAAVQFVHTLDKISSRH
jgi:lipid-binding SYLF domain-containing protein